MKSKFNRGSDHGLQKQYGACYNKWRMRILNTQHKYTVFLLFAFFCFLLV